jgi:adenylate kinase family enzyme
MKRVIIIGCGGAGKSTLARQLGEKSGLPVVHLDKIYWKPGWVKMPVDAFNDLLDKEIEKEYWIMDGNFNRTLPKRLERCDTVIYLDFSRMTCLMGVVKRILTTYGTVRPDMGAGCPERVDLEFLKWVWNFNKNKREEYYRLLKETTHAQVLIFKNRRAVKKFLKNL